MKKLIGLVASVALMGSGVALAGDDWKKGDKEAHGGSGSVGVHDDKSQGDIGGSGQAGQTSGQAGQSGMGQQQGSQIGSTQPVGGQELTGRVVKAERKTVWVEHAGAIVPLKIDKSTQFTSPDIKRANDLNQGDEIRASFEVKNTENVAKSIGKADAATGGSGDVMDDSLNQDQNTLPPAPIDDGTGGSGSDLTPPDISDEGTGSDLGSDTGVNPGP